MWDFETPEYRLCVACDADCAWFNIRHGEPRWGQVEPVEGLGSDGFVHACKGHYSVYDGGN